MAAPGIRARDHGEQRRADVLQRSVDRRQEEAAYASALRRRMVRTDVVPVTVLDQIADRHVLQKDFVNRGTATLEIVFEVDGETNEVRAYVALPDAASHAGAILVSNGTSWALLSPGSVGQSLKINGSGIPEWAT